MKGGEEDALLMLAHHKGGLVDGGRGGWGGPQDSQQLPALPWGTGNAYSRQERGIMGEVTSAGSGS